MTREMLAAALEAEGLKAANHAFAIPDNRDATCFVSGAGDIMPIARVVKLELLSGIVRIETTKQEHLYFAYEDVLGLRLLAAPAAKDRAAGFSR
jgi:hypothetical protein